MASSAQSLETLAAQLKYGALDDRMTLLCLVGYFASQSNLTAQQAVIQAAQQGYAALSDQQLDTCLLAVIT